MNEIKNTDKRSYFRIVENYKLSRCHGEPQDNRSLNVSCALVPMCKYVFCSLTSTEH